MVGLLNARAKPKSANFITPLFVSSTFAAFMSRCKIYISTHHSLMFTYLLTYLFFDYILLRTEYIYVTGVYDEDASEYLWHNLLNFTEFKSHFRIWQYTGQIVFTELEYQIKRCAIQWIRFGFCTTYMNNGYYFNMRINMWFQFIIRYLGRFLSSLRH